MDPKLSGEPLWPMTLNVQESPTDLDCWANVWAESEQGQTVALVPPTALNAMDTIQWAWNGRDEKGLSFDPGVARVVASVACGPNESEAWARTTDEQRIHIVRLGITEVDFLTHPQQGAHVPLAYHKASLLEDRVSIIGDDVADYQVRPTTGADLDNLHGEPHPPIDIWTGAFVPPWGDASPTVGVHNVPTAYVAGSQLRLSIRVGEDAISQVDGQTIPAFGESTDSLPLFRVVADGLTALDMPEEVQPGDDRAFEGPILEDTLGREERSFTWHFEHYDSVNDDWVALPGHQTTTHRIYRLAGEAVLLDGQAEGLAPDVPWIGVLEDTLAAVDGISSDPARVLDALRNHIYDNPYIIYDPGDSAYSSFEGEYIYWDSIQSNISGWLDREKGIHLYCHSVSCLLSTLAGNLGVEAEQIVLGVGFRTNLTRAAGTDDWLRWSFNSTVW